MSTQDSILNTPTLQDEIWKPVIGYEGIYEVSRSGLVRALQAVRQHKPGRILKPKTTNMGYLEVGLYKDRKRHWYLIHRLVAVAFLPPQPTPKHEVNHINSNRADARAENLEWVTKSENAKHGLKYGNRNNHGEYHSRAKLTWEQVREIRVLFSTDLSDQSIGEVFHVSRGAIKEIRRGANWKEDPLTIKGKSVVN